MSFYHALEELTEQMFAAAMNDQSESIMEEAGHPWLSLYVQAFSPQRAERSQIRVPAEDSKAGDETIWGFLSIPSPHLTPPTHTITAIGKIYEEQFSSQ